MGRRICNRLDEKTTKYIYGMEKFKRLWNGKIDGYERCKRLRYER